MDIIEIASIDDSRVEVFSSLTEAQLCDKSHWDNGLFIAESPKVIRVALEQGFEPVCMLCERKHITGDAADIVSRCPADMPLYTSDRKTLASITGYTLTRGVLCAMRRRPMPTPASVCDSARRVVVLDGICDTTNIGAIFRSAAALGADGILLTPTTCDPLNRRAVRVSMGSVFLVPWTRISADLHELRYDGFKTVAMALRDNSLSLTNPILAAEPKLAIIMGTEGDGLSNNIIDTADYTVRIPMHHNVDSLNVATATAIALYELCNRGTE